jgi:hypothetical protein
MVKTCRVRTETQVQRVREFGCTHEDCGQSSYMSLRFRANETGHFPVVPLARKTDIACCTEQACLLQTFEFPRSHHIIGVLGGSAPEGWLRAAHPRHLRFDLLSFEERLTLDLFSLVTHKRRYTEKLRLNFEPTS